MRHTLALFFISLLIACNDSPKKQDTSEPDSKQVLSEKVESSSNTSGDYSSLYNNDDCDMSIAELAEVLKVPESNLEMLDKIGENKCSFDLKGFGTNTLDGDSRISWRSTPSSKKQNKKEIASYLERKEAGLKIMGMDIELAETGDCYIAQQPAHGRIIIYNENYDQALLMHYGIKSANTDRTKEQHEELRLKMTDLANYLLQKHRK
ncbi:hypothetical protein [Maribacter forsetii]|uniref:hypothetical protein n=1 Tax=Maribacter forsetii TaxID=444515 RepID=UPI0012FB89C3|nr:hypothetical protein [Maribacter forsetii]